MHLLVKLTTSSLLSRESGPKQLPFELSLLPEAANVNLNNDEQQNHTKKIQKDNQIEIKGNELEINKNVDEYVNYKNLNSFLLHKR